MTLSVISDNHARSIMDQDIDSGILKGHLAWSGILSKHVCSTLADPCLGIYLKSILQMCL